MNKLALHPKKTNYLIFTNSQAARSTKRDLFIDNNNPNCPVNNGLISPILRVTGEEDNPTIKFLGINFDPFLTFKHHIQAI